MINATFNNNSVISWRSVLLVKETDKLYHMMLYQVHLAWVGFKFTLVVMGTIAQVLINPTIIRSRPLQPLTKIWCWFILKKTNVKRNFQRKKK